MRKIKKKYRLLSSFLIIFIISLLPIFKGNNIYKYISNSVNNPIKKLSAERQAVYDKMKVESLEVISRTTGTAPFDNTSDENGNDSSTSDDIVRTFDKMGYNVLVHIAPNTTQNLADLKGGVIKVIATLPEQGDNTVMRWEQDAWMQNVQYKDDNRSIYAEYHIPNTVSKANSTQELSFTVSVDGYKVDVTDEMKPTFKIWMEGNKPDKNPDSNVEAVTIQDDKDIIISGHESYDIVIKNGNQLNIKGEREIDGEQVTGQYLNYGVAVGLYQDKSGYDDLRGVCYPSTDEFNVSLSMKYGVKTTTSEGWLGVVDGKYANGTQVIEWGVSSEDKPNYYPQSSSYVKSVSTLPKGYARNVESSVNSVQNSGQMELEQSDGKINIKFKNYKLNGTFPDRGWGDSIAQDVYKKYGLFAVGNFEVFAPYYNTANVTSYKLRVSLESASTKSSNGTTITMNSSNGNTINNNDTAVFYTTPQGDGWGMIKAQDTDNKSIEKENLGNGASLLGKEFVIFAPYRLNDGPYEGGADAIVAWNTKFFQLEKMNNENMFSMENLSVNGFDVPSTDNIKYYYGIYNKNDEQAITKNSEANAALDSDFTWYNNYDEALENGKISAIKVDDPDLIGYAGQRDLRIKFSTVNNQENIGKVGIFRFRLRGYFDKERTQIYYYGGETEYKSDNAYKASVYNTDGTFVNEDNLRLGESVLVIGEEGNVEVSVSDKDQSGKIKTTYDVQDGKMNIVVTPSLTNGNEASATDPYSENVKVDVLLPKGLTYTMGSSNITPNSIDTNPDGTTIITWIYDSVQVNHSVPIISFSADISAIIENNTKLVVKSTIKSADDHREETLFRTGTYEVGISNLAGSMVLKEIDKPLIEIGESFTITSTIGNGGKENSTNLKSLEILPQNGDENGSSYSGSYEYKITSGATGQRFFYTTNSIDNIGITKDKYGKDTIKDVNLINDSRWHEISVGDTLPTDATALATYLPELEVNKNAKYVVEVTPIDNEEYDKYVFSFTLSNDNLGDTAIKSNFVVAQGVNREIMGIYFEDSNGNGFYDNEDNLLDNKTVILLDEDGKQVSETKTDSDGKYVFKKLLKGSYIVKFENMGDTYNVIVKGGDNKANENYQTDLINHTMNPTSVNCIVRNINIGVSKKKTMIKVYYIYQGESEPFYTKGIGKYYGESYSTRPLTNVPKNYELVGTPDNASGIADRPVIEVTYVYKKKDSTIELELETTGTEEITKKDEEVNYSIKTTGTIKDYIGDGTVTITSVLPYEIDESKSNLNGGTYNSDNKTITWTFSSNIDTFEGRNNRINITRNIKVVYKSIDSTKRSMTNTISAFVVLDNNRATKSNEVATNIKIEGTVRVFYVEKDENGNNVEIQDAVNYTKLVGETVNIDTNVKGYKLVEQPETTTFTCLDNIQEITLVYEKETYTISVKAINDGGGVINGEQAIKYGENSEPITIKSNEGFYIDSIVVNGKKMNIKKNTKTYELVLKSLSENMNVNVSFKKITNNPNTGDNIIKFIVIGLISLTTLFAVIIIRKKALK